MKEGHVNPPGSTGYMNRCAIFPGTMYNEEGSINIARNSSGHRVMLRV